MKLVKHLLTCYFKHVFIILVASKRQTYCFKSSLHVFLFRNRVNRMRHKGAFDWPYSGIGLHGIEVRNPSFLQKLTLKLSNTSWNAILNIPLLSLLLQNTRHAVLNFSTDLFLFRNRVNSTRPKISSLHIRTNNHWGNCTKSFREKNYASSFTPKIKTMGWKL